jgi:hypothetical protein
MLNLNWHLAREHSPNFELCRALHRRFVRNSANGLSLTFPRRVLSTKARIDKRLSDTWTDPPARPRHYQTESDPGSVVSNRLALGRFRAGDTIFRNFVPRNIEIYVVKVRIAQDGFDLRKVLLRQCD